MLDHIVVVPRGFGPIVYGPGDVSTIIVGSSVLIGVVNLRRFDPRLYEPKDLDSKAVGLVISVPR